MTRDEPWRWVEPPSDFDFPVANTDETSTLDLGGSWHMAELMGGLAGVACLGVAVSMIVASVLGKTALGPAVTIPFALFVAAFSWPLIHLQESVTRIELSLDRVRFQTRYAVVMRRWVSLSRQDIRGIKDRAKLGKSLAWIEGDWEPEQYIRVKTGALRSRRFVLALDRDPGRWVGNGLRRWLEAGGSAARSSAG